jgi:hypothetical protein
MNHFMRPSDHPSAEQQMQGIEAFGCLAICCIWVHWLLKDIRLGSLKSTRRGYFLNQEAMDSRTPEKSFHKTAADRNSTVTLAAFRSVITCCRLRRPYSLSIQALRINTVSFHKIFFNIFGTKAGERQIVFFRADIIGVSGDIHFSDVNPAQEIRYLLHLCLVIVLHCG